jgi:hypothetical protein
MIKKISISRRNAAKRLISRRNSTKRVIRRRRNSKKRVIRRRRNSKKRVKRGGATRTRTNPDAHPSGHTDAWLEENEYGTEVYGVNSNRRVNDPPCPCPCPEEEVYETIPGGDTGTFAPRKSIPAPGPPLPASRPGANVITHFNDRTLQNTNL